MPAPPPAAAQVEGADLAGTLDSAYDLLGGWGGVEEAEWTVNSEEAEGEARRRPRQLVRAAGGRSTAIMPRDMTGTGR